MGWRGARVAVAAIALAFVTAGCQYLFGYPPAIPPGDEFANPSPIATFGSGQATIAIGEAAPVRLDQLAAPGTLLRGMGAEVTFHNADGWYLRVSAMASDSLPLLGSGGYLQLDRIVDGQHWTTIDPSRCIVTIRAGRRQGRAWPRRLQGSALVRRPGDELHDEP